MLSYVTHYVWEVKKEMGTNELIYKRETDSHREQTVVTKQQWAGREVELSLGFSSV